MKTQFGSSRRVRRSGAGRGDQVAHPRAITTAVPVEAKPAARTDFKDLMIFVQSIKGAPASVILALGFTGRPMSHQELQLWTRCGHRQVTFALRSLMEIGWVSARTSRGPWRLAKGRGLPWVASASEPCALRALNNDDSPPIPQSLQEDTLTTNAPGGQLLEAMRAAGIEEPTASELACLPHVTPEYIRLHAAHARAEGLRVGVAILRMRAGEPAPPQPLSRAREIEQKLRRFAEGE